MFRAWLPVVAFLSLVVTEPGAAADLFEVNQCGALQANKGGVSRSKTTSRALDRLITKFLSDAKLTPGVSVAVVEGDKVIYARGFGFADLEECTQARTDSRYYLKSTTKSFTGMGAALLHEEGVIDLDQPISTFLPDLKLPKGLNADQISLRDHFIHTQPYFDSGVNYRTAFPGNLPESDLVAHVNKYGKTTNIGFRYSNFGPIMGAHAITRKTGIGWRELLEAKVFEPAGMTNSFATMSKARQGPMATAYLTREDGGFKKTQTKNDRQMHAAGGAVSTVEDLGRWLVLNLNEGMTDGAQVLPKRAVEHAHARQVSLKKDFLYFHRFAHGLGIYSADYEGDLSMHHFGGETHVSFMPERGLGVVVLSNAISDGVRVTHHLAATIYDHLLERSDVDERASSRVKRIKEGKEEFTRRKAAYFEKLTGKAGSGPATRSLAELSGEYANARLGEMNVEAQNGELEVVFGELRSTLNYISGDGYWVELDSWENMLPQLFTFRQSESGAMILDWEGRIFLSRDQNQDER